MRRWTGIVVGLIFLLPLISPLKAAAHVTAAVLDSLTAWHHANQPDRVDSLATAWLPIARAAADSAGLRSLLFARGRTRAAFGLARASEPDLREALALATAAGDTGARLQALRWLTVSVSLQGRVAEALAAARSLEALASTARDSTHLGWAWISMAYDHYLAGRADSASVYYARAGAILLRAGVVRGAIWARNGEGLARQQAGDIVGAAEGFRSTVDLARETGDALSEAMSLTFLGRLELQLGDPVTAEHLLSRAISIHDRYQHHREGLLSRIDLAAARGMAGRTDAAKALLDSVREAASTHGLTDLVVLAAEELADLYLAEHRPAAAIALARQMLAQPELPSQLAATELRLRLARGLAARDSIDAALRVLEEAATAGHGARLLALATEALRGRLLLRRGHPGAARTLLEPLLETGDESEQGDEVARVPALTVLGRARLLAGDPVGALRAVDEAVVHWDTLRSRTIDPFWRERRSEAAGDLFAHAVAIKLREPAAQSSEERLAAAYALLQRYKARTLRERMLGPDDRLRQGSPLVAAESVVTLPRVQGVLTAREILLDAVVGAENGTLFIIAADTVFVVELPALSLAAASLLNAALQAPDLVDPRAAQRLAAERLGPLDPAVQRLLASAHRVFWCPDGDLHGLPLVILAGAPGWLPPEAEISLIPAAGVLVQLRGHPASPPRPAADRMILALAGKTSGLATDSLTGSDAETAWLAAHMRGVRRASTLSAAAHMWRRARIVHLAAHVETTPRQPWRTAAVLGEGEQGLLRAADIPAAPVAAELVVLAGCRTAGNEVLGGEGLLGLGTGFLAAGVPVVLATLWDVDDHVTARIIADFYTALAAGHTAAGALAVAQRARRADSLTSAPWYWAGFVVLGDGARTVMVKPRRPAWPLIAAMLAAAAILASVATVGWRRRS